MKFLSKSPNLTVVLRNGIPANHVLGSPSVPGLYAKFKDGFLETNNQEMIDLLLKCPSYSEEGVGSGFKIFKEEAIDPWKSIRKSSEPGHIITERPGTYDAKTYGDGPKLNLQPEQMKLIEEMAKKMAVEMLIKMSEQSKTETVKEEDLSVTSVEYCAPATNGSGVEKAAPKKAGRPPKKIE